jgi:hypothetical protein
VPGTFAISARHLCDLESEPPYPVPGTIAIPEASQPGARHHCDPRFGMLANLVHTPGARHLLRPARMLANQPPYPVPGTIAIQNRNAGKSRPHARCQAPAATGPDASKSAPPIRCQAPIECPEIFQIFPDP